MRLSMKARRELTHQVSQRYRKATRKEKGLILNEFVSSSGYNRSYAATLLRGYGKKHLIQTDKGPLMYQPTKKRHKGGGRPLLYTQPIREALEWLWSLFGHKCGKLLVPIIRNNIESIKKVKPLSDLSEKELNLMTTVSPSTVDRLLKEPRNKLKIKGTSYTRSDKSLINEIPIRTFGDWKNVPPGHFQIDCVGHDGGVVSGQCCFTLTAVDVFSGWCERRGLLNRAHKWVIEALDLIRADCPLQFSEIHPDNGSEFINHALVAYCKKDENPRMTRSRPGKKNDNCYVEQKNFDTVRKVVGYARFTTPQALELLNEIYHVQGLLQNYVYPVHKLVEKTRIGSRYVKKYDTPKTPAMRILDDPNVDETVKKEIQRIQKSINPVALALEVSNLQAKLIKHAEVLDSAYPNGKGA